MENQSVEKISDIERINSASQIRNSNTYKKYLAKPILSIIVLSAIVFAVGGYFLGRYIPCSSQNIFTQALPEKTLIPNDPLPNTSTLQSIKKSPFGSSYISFADSGGEIYLKHTIILRDKKVEFPNTKERFMENIYLYDEYKEPTKLINLNSSNYIWTDLVDEEIYDSTDFQNILVWDELSSFRKVPGSPSFVFIMSWDRTGQKRRRDIFYYDRSSGEVKIYKILSFIDDKTKMTYPKIDTFSNDSRYVSLNLYGCWYCGGHQPETLLIDLKTLKTKNIGKVLQFTWGQNGFYEYKDYIVVDCKEIQPGECNQDQNTLPFKSGNL